MYSAVVEMPLVPPCTRPQRREFAASRKTPRKFTIPRRSLCSRTLRARGRQGL